MPSLADRRIDPARRVEDGCRIVLIEGTAMDLISDNSAYVLLLAFGAFAVAVHAYGLYGTPLKPADDDGPASLLNHIDLPFLGGPRAYNSGYLCYLAIVEFLYLVLSSSSLILELSLSVLESDGTIGAMTLDKGEFNPLTPLVASSVVMTLAQIKPFSQVENAIRRIAHRVAGIPDGIYDTVSRIDSFDLDDAASDDAAAGGAFEAATQLAARVEAKALSAGLSTTDAATLAARVRWVYCLRAWTIGGDADRLWSRQSVVALRNAIALAQSTYTRFDKALMDLCEATEQDDEATEDPTGRSQSGTPRRDTFDAWTTLSASALDTRDDLSILLALLMINQPPARRFENDGAAPVARLIQHLRHRDETRAVNVLLVSSIAGLAIGSCLALLYYLVERPISDAVAESNAVGQRLLPRLQESLTRTRDSAVPIGLIFAVSTLVAVSVRAGRESSMQWIYWRQGGYPVRQYLSVSFLATLIAFLFYTLYNFYAMVVQPSFMVEHRLLSPSLLRDFADQFSDFVLVPLIGAICAAAVCFLSDSQVVPAEKGRRFGRPETRSLSRRDTALWTFRFAAFCGLLNAGIRIENGSVDTVSRALEALLMPTLLLGPCFYLFATLYGGSPVSQHGQESESAIDAESHIDDEFDARLGDAR